MSSIDTSDALDFTKENIRPLKQGRKPIQLETALQAQSNMEIQQKLRLEKEVFRETIKLGNWINRVYTMENRDNKNNNRKYEHTIRTYEGDDHLAPRFEYIKWLEQMYLKHGPNSNLMPLIEETVQKFKDDPKYKQDPRFVQILIKFIDNQSNAAELYQTVYNQGLGTMCAIFYRAWADLLERHNDVKRVDQIYMLGIKSKAEPAKELEEAHIQFQLSIARRAINGEFLNDEDTNPEPGKRHALNVLKKSEVQSGIRYGSGGIIGKVPQVNNVNGKSSTLRIFEDNNENELFGVENGNYNIVNKGIDKENTVKPGVWSKPKKSRTKVPKPEPTVNFEVHEDSNADCVKKLSGIKVPHALRSRKKVPDISCPIAVFELPDPTKKPMYCKDKVYGAGTDVQLEEIRAEIYFKEREKIKGKRPISVLKSPFKEKEVKPLKKVILPEDNLNTIDFKVPQIPRMEPNHLSQSVTVNTKVAIDLVQQMWNSPCSDEVEDSELVMKNRKPIPFDAFEDNENQLHVGFDVFEDDKIPTENEANDENVFKQKLAVKSVENFCVYTDDDQEFKAKVPKVYVDDEVENKKTSKLFDKNDLKPSKSSIKFEVHIDDENMYQDKNYNNKFENETYKVSDSTQSLPVENMNPVDENKSPFKKIQSVEVDDDMTCSTKAFAFLLSSSTPLAQGKSKPKSGLQLQPLKQVDVKENETIQEFQTAKTLSMILEASKERNSSTSSGVVSTIPSVTKVEQQSTIDFGDSINPFDDELLKKLLQKVIKFPDTRHMSGYIEYDSDIPNMRSEFKLGHQKMSFLSQLGKGSYARVVKVRCDDENLTEKALKIQKPSCVWEWYISKEIQYRLKDPEKLSYFINMDMLHLFKNGSIISMDFATYGTLLSVILAYKSVSKQSIPITVAALLSSQITSAVKFLHQCQIIHGDLKPDNIIVKSLPHELSPPCVQLIDFGRSIDMTLFPPDTTFTYCVKTADFVCHEMRDALPWTYQTDYYGLAGIIYMILISDYMKTQKIRKSWVLVKPLPRYIDKDLWGHIINLLLNIESCKTQPNLDTIINKLNKFISMQSKIMINHNLASLKNALKNN